MIYVWATLLTLVNLVWLALVILGLPGNWLMVLCAGLVTWWQWPAAEGHLSTATASAASAAMRDAAAAHPGAPMFSVVTLVVVAAVALVGEVLEFFAGVAGAKKAGATWRGSVGAIIGSLVGGVAATFLIPIPLVGSLIGACGGAFAGAWALEFGGGRKHEEALKSGVGAGVGRLMGTIIKLGAGVIIWIVLAVAAFWP